MMLTHSGLRGIIGKTLTLDDVKKYCLGFSQLVGKNSKILIGRDTRSSSPELLKIVSQTLQSAGLNLIDAGIVPTPVILFEMTLHNYDGAIIITGSHNPPEYNGIKFINSTGIFLGAEEIAQLNQLMKVKSKSNLPDKLGRIEIKDIIPDYLDSALLHLKFPNYDQKTVSVLADPNAGTGYPIIKMLFDRLGYPITVINEKVDGLGKFPHEIEPIPKNLISLSEKMVESKHTIGFAFDCDADRIAIVDECGKIYTEDIAIALLVNSILEKYQKESNNQKIFIVTNIASSHIFDEIAERYGANLIRTPIGERFLIIKMKELRQQFPDSYIIGGEGSSGGFIYPEFNHARDGIFAAAKICEILIRSEKRVSQLINNLPRYFSHREKIHCDEKFNINYIEMRLRENEIKFSKYGSDLIIESDRPFEWLLLHPSNTEPIIRIIAESKLKEKSIELSKWILSLINT